MSEEKNNQTSKSEQKEGEVTKGEVKENPGKTDDPTTSSSVSKNKEVTVFKSLTPEKLKQLDYPDFNTPARMLALGEAIAGSKLCPLKTKEDVALAMMTGRELGLPMVVSLSQIYPIEGKPSLGTHLIRALILKAGIVFEKIEDAVPLYKFAKKNEEGKLVVNANKEPIIVHVGLIDEQPKNTGKSVAGYRTTYEFTRQLKQPDGSYKELKAKGSFSTIEAAEADILKKPNWQNYWRRMLDARAFNNGAREIADDIISGLHTPDELGAVSYINERGEEIVEDISHEEVN